MEQPKLFLKEERQCTDDSLNAERDKTNRSFARSRTKAEKQIDSAVTQKRLKADQAVEVAQDQSDSKNEKRGQITTNEAQAEKQNGQKRVDRERERSEKAVDLERSEADAAVEKERQTQRDLAGQLLNQERELTDKNLSFERTQTDSEVQKNSSLLSEERADHSKTKISLTTRNEFLAIVSHDLRNPIGAAAACAKMLVEDSTYGSIDPEVKHWIEFIKRNVDVSLRLITDLLDMERMALGKLELQLEKNHFREIIQHSIESFAHEASAKNIALKMFPIVGADEVVCDRDRILQVLSNLIGNAVKFTPEGGSIQISASAVNSKMQVSIKDRGAGIPHDKLSQIFDRFEQLGSNDRRGLGLGLYISKMLIDAHGGQIWVESKLNQGSTFSFEI